MSLKLNSNSINYNVATVLDLTSIVNPSINDTVVVTEEGRGGVFIYRADGTSNGGTIFDSSSTGKWHRQYEGSVNVKWFGAKGDGVTDDTLAIQNAINYISTTGYSSNSLGGWAYIGSRKKLVFPDACIIAISSTITITQYYDFIDFNNCLFVPHPSFVHTNYAIDILAWLSTFNNLMLSGFSKGIHIHNPNLDTGKIVFSNIKASNIIELFTIDCQSTHFKVENFRFDKVTIAANILSCDHATFSSGWYSTGIFSSDYQANFLVNNSAALTVNDMIYVPIPQTALKTNVFKLLFGGASITISDCLFGGEPGNQSLVAVYSQGTPAAPGRASGISISDTSGFTTSNGRAVVELYDLPNYVNIHNYRGAIEETHTNNLISYVPDFKTYSVADSEFSDTRLSLTGNFPKNYNSFAVQNRDDIATKLITENKITRLYFTNLTDASSGLVLDKSKAGRGNTYRIEISNIGNNGADRLSVYYAAGAIDNSAGASSFELKTILASTSTVGANLFISDGNVYIRANNVAASSFNVKITPITNWDLY